MSRPTKLFIDSQALLHNVRCIKSYAPNQKIIAMVKANAYGCGLAYILPILEGQVDAFGVASLEEAVRLRQLGSSSDCILFQGIFSHDELQAVVNYRLQCVIHHEQQLQWFLNARLKTKLKLWVKVNTGMYRLGFPPEEVARVFDVLRSCPWADKNIGLMTHLACADNPGHELNNYQLSRFNAIDLPGGCERSIANSAAIMALPDSHADWIRPGIMLYGVSPFPQYTGYSLGLLPVMNFLTTISAIHHLPANTTIGYGACWQSDKEAIIGVIPAGYGDGYPRHVNESHVWVNGNFAPVAGRISMDMMAINLTNCSSIKIGDPVELWGKHMPIETVANAASTSPYELLTQVSERVRIQ